MEESVKEIGHKKKIVFFTKQGMDSFLGDIITGLSAEYETKKTIVTDYRQIDEGIQWADICWFEWCDDLVVYGSKLIIKKGEKVICRLHSYEAFTDYPSKVNWNKVDKIVFVAEHIKNYVSETFKIDKSKMIVIPNGIDINKLDFSERKQGYNIAYVGYINYKKGPMLLLHTFKAIYDKDRRFKLFIAGQFQDNRDILYFNQMIKEFGIENNIFFTGWQDNLDAWLEDKNYILCTSILESQNISVMQAMAKGIKPLIHNFVGAKDVYDNKYIWNTIDEVIRMIYENNYNSKEYMSFIESNYSLSKQLIKVKELLSSLYKIKVDESLNLEYLIYSFGTFVPYSSEYIDKFIFADCYICIGKKELITENIYLVEFIVKNKFGNQLVLNNILYNMIKNNIILPDYILNSRNCNLICELMNSCLNLKNKLSKNIEGYIFDEGLSKDIEENQLAYLWERGIPATQFMPALGWLKIIERYKFALNFIDPSHTILEAASGFGYGAAYLHDKCKYIYALDLAQQNIEFAKCSYDFDNISWINGDVTKLPFEDNRFDLYTSFETLEHIPIDLVEAYFKEAVRVLKDDGIMIISTPNAEQRKNINNPFHIKEYDYSEFDKMLYKHFSSIQYYSVVDYKVEYGMKSNAVNMIAVCTNGNKKIKYDNLNNNYREIDLMKIRFMINSDDIKNSESLFNYLIDNNMEREYMKYISEWFLRSSYDYTNRFNYYFCNMYRKIYSYNRFKFIDYKVYKEIQNIGQQLFNKLSYKKAIELSKCESKKKVLFILNGIDSSQSVNKFFIDYLRHVDRINYEYLVLSLLNENEFDNYNKSIGIFNELKIEVFIPKSGIIEEKVEEIYDFLNKSKFEYAIFQSMYFASLSSLILPYFINKGIKTGRVVFQQNEDFVDNQMNFLIYYLKKDFNIKHKCIFDKIWPIDTSIVNKNYSLRSLFNITNSQKVLISIGRDIKYKNIDFWNYVKKMLEEANDIIFVFFGIKYSDVEEYLERKYVNNYVFFGGLDENAAAYLKDADYYLNSFPVGGGITLLEAYYADLPIISFAPNDDYSSCTVISALYKDVEKYYPKNGDIDKLAEFTLNIINDHSFAEKIYNTRIIDPKELEYTGFCRSFEEFLLNFVK